MSDQIPAAVLEVRGLRKTYESRSETLAVLRDVSFDLARGRTVVISGQSGCGKTTLLNLLGGLDHPTSGSIAVAGREIAGMGEDELGWFRNRYLGFIFQFHYLLRDFTALENVMMPARIAGSSVAASRARAAELLDAVGLASRSAHYPFELSGGERQRVAVARALMNDPTLLLADEPTGNLDEENSRGVAAILFGLIERYGKSMVLVTHDAALLDRGEERLVLEGGSVHTP
jgi:lipoprotein-releasing system ATP-binding protein